MANKIVFLLGSYYPNYSAVGRCQGNIADELEREGYEITVIAEKTNMDEAETEYLGGQRIIRITNKDLRKRLIFRNRKDFPGRIVNQFLRVNGVIHKIVNKHSLKQYAVLAYYDALKSLDFVPDIIVPTCLPFETVVAAIKYKSEIGKCRVVPVLYDMFAENNGLTLTAWNKIIKEKSNISIESETFKYCDRILHMPSWTPHLKKHHEDIMGKTKEVEHPLIKKPFTQHERIYRSGINLAFIGEVDNKIRNPQPVLGLFLQHDFSDVKMHFYVTGNAAGKIEDAGKHCSAVVYHGEVDNSYAHNVIAEADILISIGYNVADQFPGKIFEYMSTGKPIIHFYQTVDDPALEVLRSYPLALCIHMNDIQCDVVRSFICENYQKRLEFDTVRGIFENASHEIFSSMLTEKLGKGIVLVFAGSLNKKHVEPDAYIEFMTRVKYRGLFKTKFFSSGNATFELDNKEISGISHTKWIPHEKLKYELRNADILLSIAQIEGKQISSKIFEYMSYGKPILHIYYNDEDVNLNYLKKYPLSLLLRADDITKDTNDIEEQLVRLSWLSLSFDDMPDYFICMTPQYLANELLQ